MPAFSYQLYSSRNFPSIADTLAMLAAAGYREAEGYGGAIEAAGGASGLRALLDANGLCMPTAHFGLSAVEADPAGAITDAKVLGVSTMVIPWLPPEDRPSTVEGWSALGRRVEIASKPLRDAGFGVAWHNHDFELFNVGHDQMPLDLLMHAAPSLKLELDVAWVYVAKEDPVRWINAYRDRLVSIHLKDRAPAGQKTNEDGWADLGTGELDWPRIVAAIQASSARHFIVEHDNPSDHARFARNSIAFANAIWG
ncbi:MAG: sugar phosphate isomerase/epimerase [Rhizobiaceae bacterium]|jgi:sugar phosphate isomerase/epimerase|nr:sugar phosphate isomerase/epimerase [Rhizobiaceae bacterium]